MAQCYPYIKILCLGCKEFGFGEGLSGGGLKSNMAVDMFTVSVSCKVDACNVSDPKDVESTSIPSDKV
jgi:hypothetical protein